MRFHLPQAFGEYTDIYMRRVEELKQVLLNGQLHKAKELCKLDFEPGWQPPNTIHGKRRLQPCIGRTGL